ncbi:hypothetical protein F4778DRAFT_759862, partial [Xylariomycetidae sp. FL2044]
MSDMLLQESCHLLTAHGPSQQIGTSAVHHQYHNRHSYPDSIRAKTLTIHNTCRIDSFTLSEHSWNAARAKLVAQWKKIVSTRRLHRHKRSMVKKLAPEQKRSSQSASQKRGNIASDHHPGFEPCPRGFEGRREPLKQDRERSKPKDTSFQQPSQIDRMDKQVKASAARAPRHSQTEQSERGRTPDQYLALKKQEAIERFMAAFNEWLEKRLAIVNYAYGAAESAGTPSGGSYEDGGGGQAGRDTSRRPKRQLGGDEKDNSSAGGDENGGDRGGNKRAKKDAEIERKWACPFYKHDPRAHSGRRSCAGPGWTSIHRLKEHIYRIHRLPKHTCPRCNKPFDDSKDLSEHLRADTLCEKLNVAPSEGIDETTEAKLKVRKRHSPGVSDEQRWREIYLILFPDANPDATPSPC